ncbi:MAG: polysaccharide biosynthesis/export family protein [Paludibacteraceae bacterium]|nr:polysaccharide biosynthesis/export family protein [Paludibacteraceae bacterium]MBQ6748707.1 polysaccharide biosynthesis/export family protein [Paludibacteraceae bacterium]MBQ6763863.1 polysaccharide biosynthesis/export family protein [Paludibacteraceae bacterium]
MRKIQTIFLLLLMAVAMTGCYSHRAIGYLQEPTKSNKLPVYDSVPYQPYRIRVNDEIIYRLITMDETISKSLGNNTSNTGQYANSYRVFADGTVDLPFLKPIKVQGLTETEAQDTLRAAFKEIIPDADVKVALYNKYFSVVGDANAGRYFIYKEKMNIFQALAMTGDVMNSGDRRHIRIIRPRDGGQEPEILEFDMRTNSIIDSKYYYVYPNDVIYVARTKDSFFKVPTYTGFLGLITSSVSLLITVLNQVLLLSR